MENELQKLRDIFFLINLNAFCEKYSLQYHYLQKNLKGTVPLTEKKYKEYRDALADFSIDYLKDLGRL